MDKKKFIRKKSFLIRKKKYFEINEKFFFALKKIIENKKISKRSNIALYFPSSNEVNVFKILEVDYFKKFNFLLPIIEKNHMMNFYKWKKNDILKINKYGIPEPVKSKIIIPNIILVPLLAYDKNKNRIGYGKGYYDRYLRKFLKTQKKTLIVGVAFSFQKYHKLPVTKKDFRLNYIITEKGII